MAGSELEEHVNTSSNPQKYVGEGTDFRGHPRSRLGLLLCACRHSITLENLQRMCEQMCMNGHKAYSLLQQVRAEGRAFSPLLGAGGDALGCYNGVCTTPTGVAVPPDRCELL